MGKINGCLKCLFIFFNVLFLIVGCLLIFVAVKATAVSIQMSTFGGPGVGWIWVITLGVFGISALGIFAACSEKELFLKIFAGFMGIGMIIMLIFGTVVAVLRNSLKQNYESKSKEFVEPIMKDEESRQVLETLQITFKCCGVVSAKDWGSQIPTSCECTDTSRAFGAVTCKPRPVLSSGPALIYAESCSDSIFYLLDIGFKISLGFLFGFAVTALLGLLISILMIHQIRRHDGMGGPSIAMKGY
ncbi:CD63 antigen-like [Poecilia latipinna]|uniref:Tetraspanin n=2 Tax=Poecilia TaxID=8080 RepID=A0A087X5L4_POEFO|nr:PREDICTED: CD63 antigen-like [Poecilia formosa]XP_014906365.1 PREDICTED: CD63 antigen-like [Poecilia latipinna]